MTNKVDKKLPANHPKLSKTAAAQTRKFVKDYFEGKPVESIRLFQLSSEAPEGVELERVEGVTHRLGMAMLRYRMAHPFEADFLNHGNHTAKEEEQEGRDFQDWVRTCLGDDTVLESLEMFVDAVVPEEMRKMFVDLMDLSLAEVAAMAHDELNSAINISGVFSNHGVKAGLKSAADDRRVTVTLWQEAA